jgi:prevent-host-death family protein
MRFVTVRELRTQSAQTWRRLADEGDLVITSNGKPIAVLVAVSEGNLEESLAALRRAKAIAAVEAMQRRAAQTGTPQLSEERIRAEIASVRQDRPQ